MALHLEDLLKAQAKQKAAKGEIVSTNISAADIAGNIGDVISIHDLRQMVGEAVSANVETAENLNVLVGEIKNATESLDTEESSLSGQDLERENEKLDLMEEQNEVLEKIEENTRPSKETTPKPTETQAPASTGGNSLFSALLGGVGAGLMGGLGGGMIGGMLKTAGGALIGGLFKGLLRTAVIPMLAFGLVNGLIDGYKEFQKSGDLGEAVIKGLGGLLETISLGMLDEDSIRTLANNIKDWWELLKEDFMDALNVIPDALFGKEDGITDKEYHDIIKKAEESGVTGAELEKLKVKTEKRIDTSIVRNENDGLKYEAKKSEKSLAAIIGERDISIKNEKGEEIVKIVGSSMTYNGEKLYIESKQKNQIEEYITNNEPTKAIEYINNILPSVRSGNIGLQPQSYQIDEFTGEKIIIPQQSVIPDSVLKSTQEIQENQSAPDGFSGNVAVSTNVSNTTNNKTVTNLPPVRSRNEENSFMDIFTKGTFYS